MKCDRLPFSGKKARQGHAKLWSAWYQNTNKLLRFIRMSRGLSCTTVQNTYFMYDPCGMIGRRPRLFNNELGLTMAVSARGPLKSTKYFLYNKSNEETNNF